MKNNVSFISLIAASCAIFGASSAVNAGLVINVGFSAQQTTVNVGQQFVIDVVADLPLGIIGWGLQIGVDDPAVVNIQGPPLTLLPWHPTITIENGGTWQFGGLAFPDAVSGQGVLLASINFMATQVGETDLILTIDPHNPTQGFVAGPPAAGGLFGSVQLNLGHVTVVPAPGATLFIGMLAIRGRRRR